MAVILPHARASMYKVIDGLQLAPEDQVPLLSSFNVGTLQSRQAQVPITLNYIVDHIFQ